MVFEKRDVELYIRILNRVSVAAVGRCKIPTGRQNGDYYESVFEKSAK